MRMRTRVWRGKESAFLRVRLVSLLFFCYLMVRDELDRAAYAAGEDLKQGYLRSRSGLKQGCLRSRLGLKQGCLRSR